MGEREGSGLSYTVRRPHLDCVPIKHVINHFVLYHSCTYNIIIITFQQTEEGGEVNGNYIHCPYRCTKRGGETIFRLSLPLFSDTFFIHSMNHSILHHSYSDNIMLPFHVVTTHSDTQNHNQTVVDKHISE